MFVFFVATFGRHSRTHLAKNLVEKSRRVGQLHYLTYGRPTSSVTKADRISFRNNDQRLLKRNPLRCGVC
jgi:hypothetical protein